MNQPIGVPVWRQYQEKMTVRITADFTKLNKAVCREKFILRSVEHTLGMLAGASIFSKLDANMGF